MPEWYFQIVRIAWCIRCNDQLDPTKVTSHTTWMESDRHLFSPWITTDTCVLLSVHCMFLCSCLCSLWKESIDHTFPASSSWTPYKYIVGYYKELQDRAFFSTSICMGWWANSISLSSEKAKQGPQWLPTIAPASLFAWIPSLALQHVSPLSFMTSGMAWVGRDCVFSVVPLSKKYLKSSPASRSPMTVWGTTSIQSFIMSILYFLPMGGTLRSTCTVAVPPLRTFSVTSNATSSAFHKFLGTRFPQTTVQPKYRV